MDVSTINYLRIFGRGLQSGWGFEAEFHDFVKVCEIYMEKNTHHPRVFRNFRCWFLCFKDSTSYPANNQKTWNPPRWPTNHQKEMVSSKNSKCFQFHLETVEFVSQAISFGRPPPPKKKKYWTLRSIQCFSRYIIQIYLIGCYVFSCLHILCIYIYILCIYIYLYGYILHKNHHLKHTRVFSNPWRPSLWRPTMR